MITTKHVVGKHPTFELVDAATGDVLAVVARNLEGTVTVITTRAGYELVQGTYATVTAAMVAVDEQKKLLCPNC